MNEPILMGLSFSIVPSCTNELIHFLSWEQDPLEPVVGVNQAKDQLRSYQRLRHYILNRLLLPLQLMPSFFLTSLCSASPPPTTPTPAPSY